MKAIKRGWRSLKKLSKEDIAFGLVILSLIAAQTVVTELSDSGLLDDICEAAVERGETATVAEYRADPGAHADDFCALAKHEPHKAAKQLDQSIRLSRNRETPKLPAAEVVCWWCDLGAPVPRQPQEPITTGDAQVRSLQLVPQHSLAL